MWNWLPFTSTILKLVVFIATQTCSTFAVIVKAERTYRIANTPLPEVSIFTSNALLFIIELITAWVGELRDTRDSEKEKDENLSELKGRVTLLRD